MEPQGLELLHGDAPDPLVGEPDEPMTLNGVTLLLLRGAAVCNAARTAYQPSELRPWELTAARFVDLTARIMVLGSTVGARGGAGAGAGAGAGEVPVPVRLQPGGRRLREIGHWCAATVNAIPSAWRVHQERTRAQVLAGLSTRRARPSAEVLSAARALAGRRDAWTAPPESLRDQQVRRRFQSMAPEAPAAGVEEALVLGARAIATTSRVAARAYADELISVVRDVNEETARRQAERLTAARYLLALGATPLEQYAHGRDLIARLGQVLAGETRLTGDLHDACERLCGILEADVCADRLSELLHRSLTEHGFTVRIDRESAAPAILFSAFEKGTAARCGSLVIDDGMVVTAPPRSQRRLSASAASAAFHEAVDHFRRQLGMAVSSTLRPRPLTHPTLRADPPPLYGP
ncbi:hypothetical protein [Actinomadura sp. 9N215]|uniref:hypothetical protein n=1 Tax=Actinomadura sp. 9N215 TaxID=3375150 RepID=UPI0037BBEB87